MPNIGSSEIIVIVAVVVFAFLPIVIGLTAGLMIRLQRRLPKRRTTPRA